MKEFIIKGLLTVILILGYVLAQAQTLPLVKIASLPTTINESSGLEITDTSSVWTHNDSGGKNRIYKVNFSGVTVDSITITNATNVDWEDIASDADTNIYIGDFGNNNNSRKDLKIYKIPKPSSITGNATTASVISFSYSDQIAFPPGNGNLNYDVEGFFHTGDSLYLFTKNRSTANNSGYTKLYRLPDEAGNYVAELIDSFYTNELVTAADISDDGSSVALLTYFSVWIFRNFTGHNFFSVVPQKFSITPVTQKEGIVFKNDSEIYISDEKVGSTGGNIYHAKIELQTGINPKPKRPPFFLYPNPCDAAFGIMFSDFSNAERCYTIRNISGQIIQQGKIQAGVLHQEINCSELEKGEYFIEVMNESEKDYQSFLIFR